MLLCLGDLAAAVNVTFPIIEICTKARGSVKAAAAMVSGLLVVSIVMTLGSIVSASRLTWNWARDRGLPAWFSHISPRHRIFVRSIWVPIVVVICLACLKVGSYTAFSAFISLTLLALFTSYAIAISCMLRARLLDGMQHGSWSLGA
jgi:choline transport protein